MKKSPLSRIVIEDKTPENKKAHPKMLIKKQKISCKNGLEIKGSSRYETISPICRTE